MAGRQFLFSKSAHCKEEKNPRYRIREFVSQYEVLRMYFEALKIPGCDSEGFFLPVKGELEPRKATGHFRPGDLR